MVLSCQNAPLGFIEPVVLQVYNFRPHGLSKQAKSNQENLNYG